MSGEKNAEERGNVLDAVRYLADLSENLTVGETTYKLYPLSLGKMALLQKHEAAVTKLIATVRMPQDVTDEEAASQLATALDSAIEIFHIVTAPNDGNPPAELVQAEKEQLRWRLSMANIFEIMTFLRTASIPRELLKNALGPVVGAEKQTSEIGSQE